MKLKKSVVDGLEAPAQGQRIYRDSEDKGFALRVTSGTKTFVVEKRIGRKIRRIKLGRYGEMTCERARKKAKEVIGKIASGIDPVEEKRERKAAEVTLDEVFEAYLKTRGSLKSLTIKDMRRAMKGFEGWMKKPLLSITRDMVARRHKELGEASKARANLAMRYLRAIFNFAMAEYTDAKGKPRVTDNPVKKLSQTRAWYRVDRRQTVIKPHQLRPWMQAVLRLDNSLAQDYFLLVLLTGLRRTEAFNLR